MGCETASAAAALYRALLSDPFVGESCLGRRTGAIACSMAFEAAARLFSSPVFKICISSAAANAQAAQPILWPLFVARRRRNESNAQSFRFFGPALVGYMDSNFIPWTLIRSVAKPFCKGVTSAVRRYAALLRRPVFLFVRAAPSPP